MSHFHSGIGNYCRNLEGLWCSNFTCWQVRHLDTKSATSLFIPFYQYVFFKSWYILVEPGWILEVEKWAFIISFLSSSTSGTHSLVPKRNMPSLSITKSRDWLCCTSNINFYNWGSLLWATLTLSKYTNRTLNWDKMHFLVTFNYNPWSINLYSSLLSVSFLYWYKQDCLLTFYSRHRQLHLLYRDNKE